MSYYGLPIWRHFLQCPDGYFRCVEEDYIYPHVSYPWQVSPNAMSRAGMEVWPDHLGNINIYEWQNGGVSQVHLGSKVLAANHREISRQQRNIRSQSVESSRSVESEYCSCYFGRCCIDDCPQHAQGTPSRHATPPLASEATRNTHEGPEAEAGPGAETGPRAEADSEPTRANIGKKRAPQRPSNSHRRLYQ